MNTFKVKFMSGAIQGEWKRHQSYDDVVKMRTALAELTGQRVEEMYSDAFLWDESIGRWGVFTYKAETDKYNAVLYIVREYDE